MKQKLTVFHPAIAPYRVELFNSLSEAFDASFYFEFENALEQDFQQERLTKRLLFTPKYLRKGFLGIKNLRMDVLSILRKEKPDMVFCSEYNLMGFLLLIYKFLFDWKLQIYTICDDSPNIAVSTKGARQVMRSIFVRFYTGIILVNPAVVSWYQERFKNKKKFVYFPIVQEDTYFREQLKESLPMAQELLLKHELKEKKTILFVGRLIEIKNLALLIEAFAKVSKQDCNAQLIFVGEGNKEEELKQQAFRLGISKQVNFVGKKEGTELYAWYNIGQIFVLPSYYEPFGAVVNEALLAGCYTLCSTAAGASCLIEKGVNGDLFSPQNVEELNQQLSRILQTIPPLNREIRNKESLMKECYQTYFRNFINDIE